MDPLVATSLRRCAAVTVALPALTTSSYVFAFLPDQRKDRVATCPAAREAGTLHGPFTKDQFGQHSTKNLPVEYTSSHAFEHQHLRTGHHEAALPNKMFQVVYQGRYTQHVKECRVYSCPEASIASTLSLQRTESAVRNAWNCRSAEQFTMRASSHPLPRSDRVSFSRL